MISENGIPSPLMRQYVTGQEIERKAALKEMLAASYPFIFEGSFDLSTATASMLRETFSANTSASGETLVRCMTFLKDAAADAGIEVSKFILQKKGRAHTAKKRPTVARREERPSAKPDLGTTSGHGVVPQQVNIPAQASLLLTGLFQRLPVPGSKWPKIDRDQWVQTLQNVLLLEYPEN